MDVTVYRRRRDRCWGKKICRKGLGIQVRHDEWLSLVK